MSEQPNAGRGNVLAALQAATEPVSAADLAPTLHLHPNTVRGHLELLVVSGYATRQIEERDVRGRPRVLYRAVDSGAHDRAAVDEAVQSAEGYRALATALAAELARLAPTSQEAADAAGRYWATAMARDGRLSPVGAADEAIATVGAVFEELGFEVAAEPLGDRLYLSNCPYLDQVKVYRGVCDVHLGLLRGAFAETGDRVRVTDVTVEARPGLCVAHLAPPGEDLPAGPTETTATEARSQPAPDSADATGAVPQPDRDTQTRPQPNAEESS